MPQLMHQPVRSLAFAGGALVFALGDLLRRTVDGGLEGAVAISHAAHDHALAWQLGATGMVLGSVLMLPLVAHTARTAAGRGRLPRRLGGGLFAAGLFGSIGHAVAYFGLMSVLGGAEGLSATQVHALDKASESQPFLLGFIAVFIAGMLLGQLAWAVGLWRSGTAPVWLLPFVLVEAVAGGSGGVLAGVIGLVAWIGVGVFAAGMAGRLAAHDTELVGHDHGLDPVS